MNSFKACHNGFQFLGKIHLQLWRGCRILCDRNVSKIAKSFRGCCIWVEHKYVFNLCSVESNLSALDTELGRMMYVFRAETKLGAMFY